MAVLSARRACAAGTDSCFHNFSIVQKRKKACIFQAYDIMNSNWDGGAWNAGIIKDQKSRSYSVVW